MNLTECVTCRYWVFIRQVESNVVFSSFFVYFLTPFHQLFKCTHVCKTNYNLLEKLPLSMHLECDSTDDYKTVRATWAFHSPTIITTELNVSSYAK